MCITFSSMTAFARNKEKQPGLWKTLEEVVGKGEPAEDTAQHVLRRLLQPVAKGVFKLLVPGVGPVGALKCVPTIACIRPLWGGSCRRLLPRPGSSSSGRPPGGELMG